MHGITLLKHGDVLKRDSPQQHIWSFMPVMASNQKSDGRRFIVCKGFGLFGLFISYNSKHFYPGKLNVVSILFYCWGENVCVHYCSF